MDESQDYKILVVDDSTTNVVLLEAILDEKGYKIETALNAKEAYAIIERDTPDLILLDLLMPKIDGNKTCGLTILGFVPFSLPI